MTISRDIVRVIAARLTDCRCYGPVDPAGFRPCGGCEHDKHCLDEIVRLRAERDELNEFIQVLREELAAMADRELDAKRKAHAEVEEAVAELLAECYRLRAELKTSNAERDEARRGECSWHQSPLWFARYRGWDCFKQEKTP